MWPLKTILYFVLFWGACFMALFNPIWGVVNYLMVYQTNPANTWWGSYLANLGMRFSMLAAVFTVIGVFTGRKYVPKCSFSLWEAGLLFMLFLAALSQLIGAQYSAGAGYPFEKFWKMLLFVFLLGRLATTRTNFNLVLWSFVFGSMYVGYDAFTAPADAFWLGRLERIGGPDFYTTSGTAAYLAAMLPLIGAAFLTARTMSLRVAALASGALTFNAIILCRTRSAFIGLLIGSLVAALMTPRIRRYRIWLLLGVGAISAFSLTDNHFWSRMSTLTSEQSLEDDPAASMRADIWRVSFQILMDNPLGVGIGNFKNVIGDYDSRLKRRSSHNTLVVCFTEFGVQGGVVFLSLVFGAFLLLYKTSRLAEHIPYGVETKLLIYGVLISIVTYFITGLGTERFYCESFWWVLIFPLCLHRVVLREYEATQKLPLPVIQTDEDEDYSLPLPARS